MTAPRMRERWYLALDMNAGSPFGPDLGRHTAWQAYVLSRLRNPPTAQSITDQALERQMAQARAEELDGADDDEDYVIPAPPPPSEDDGEWEAME